MLLLETKILLFQITHLHLVGTICEPTDCFIVISVTFAVHNTARSWPRPISIVSYQYLPATNPLLKTVLHSYPSAVFTLHIYSTSPKVVWFPKTCPYKEPLNMRRQVRSGLISSRGRHVVITNNINYEAGNWVATNDKILKLFWSWLIESNEISFALTVMKNF